MTWNLPNILTVLRLLAAPGIALAFVVFPYPYSSWVALILFVGAALTDWLDGYLARKWDQTSRFGAMLDPIADKAMVVIALCVVVGLAGMQWLVVVPTVFILFREVFVSGLREFLGTTAGLLKVTKLAKWKTTAQMVAITLILSHGLFSHYVGMGTFGMDGVTLDAIMAGEMDDPTGIRWKLQGYYATMYGGFGLLWVAGLLTVITGYDYFRKSLPYLREGGA